MRISDILRSSLSSLLRRRLRSVLTMLGVVLGTAAIVVTLSLGEGATRAQMTALQQATNLKLIQCYPNYSGDSQTQQVDDNTLSRIRAIDHVDAVTPCAYISGQPSYYLRTGKYETNAQLMAVYPEDFIKIAGLDKGTGFTGSTSKCEFIMSPIAMVDFRNPKKDNGEWIDVYSYLENGEEIPLPNIDWLNARFDLDFIWYDYPEDGGEPIERSSSFKADMVGILKADMSSNFSWGCYVSTDWFKKMQRSNRNLFKDLDMELQYETVYVLADDVDNVVEITKQISEMGLQCSSPMEYVNQFKEQIQTTQTFLGFIGAISMLVAALSIANTMMMSIYERTREIGVMKVLGLSLNNIRLLFLTEAAYIGLFGGALGLAASFGVSYCVNNVPQVQAVLSSVMNGGSWLTGMGDVSVITPTLALTTWAGVILVSILSGIMPAQRAMKLSALAAIRNE